MRPPSAAGLAAVAALAAAIGLSGCGHDPAGAARPPASSTPTTGVPATRAAARVSTTVAPTTAATAPPGPPYRVGEVTLPLVDTSRPTVSHGTTISGSRALTTLVWFPETGGRHPLVVFGHGFQVGPSPYISLLQSWAAHGYVVAAPEFPLGDAAIAGANLDENDINQEPADLRFVTDSLVGAAGPLAARIDARRVAVAGHSDGAEAALAASIAPVPAGTPAYRALIAMSVQELPGVAHTDNPPIMVTQGDVDTINPPSYGYQTFSEAASPKYLVVLAGGGHLPPVEAGSAYLPGLERATAAFLDCYLAGGRPAGAIAGSLAGSALFRVQEG